MFYHSNKIKWIYYKNFVKKLDILQKAAQHYIEDRQFHLNVVFHSHKTALHKGLGSSLKSNFIVTPQCFW